jgi:hypothetical protein
MYSSTHTLTSPLDGGEWSASRPGRFTLRERAPGTHWRGGWVDPRAVLDAVVKRKIPSPQRESNPRTPIVQPVGQCYDMPSVREQNAEILQPPSLPATSIVIFMSPLPATKETTKSHKLREACNALSPGQEVPIPKHTVGDLAGT